MITHLRLYILILILFSCLARIDHGHIIFNFAQAQENIGNASNLQKNSPPLKTALPSSAVTNTSFYKKNISFEWDAVEGAKYYEVELTPEPASDGRPVLAFKSPTNNWSGDIAPGGYALRTRSRDKRNIPGEWSATQNFVLNLDDLKMKFPEPNQNIQSDFATENPTNISWTPVPGAVKYQFKMSSDDGSVKVDQVLTSAQYNAKLPVTKKYSYTIMAYSAFGISSEKETTGEFTLLGKKLATPKITIPENAWVRQLNWNFPPYTEEFSYAVSRWNSKTNKWDVVVKENNFKKNQIPFLPEWIGGRYKFFVQAKAKLRPSSDTAVIQFSVFDGNRSPTNEYKYTIRQSIDRTTGYFAIASYLITVMDYAGSNQDRGGASAAFTSLGGTGRLGLGYLSPIYPWGFLGVVDMSGFIINSSNYTFATTELNAIYRKNTGERSEVRHQIGLFYKELPEVIGNGLGEFETTESISSSGPHYGFEYWYAMTPRLGFQANLHTYFSMFKVKTPTNEAISPTLSYQLGLMGSYKLSKKITGLMGYAYRKDALAYKSQRFAGENNSVELTGHYLNLFLEWAL